MTVGTPAATRAEDGPGSSVTDHEIGRGEHRALVDPRLDVHVGRDGAEAERSSWRPVVSSTRTGRPVDRAQRQAVDVGCQCHVAEHRAEGQVHEWRVGPAPPVRKCGGSSRVRLRRTGRCAGTAMGRARPGSASGTPNRAARRPGRRDAPRARVPPTSIEPISASAMEIATSALGMPSRPATTAGRVLARVAQHEVGLPAGERALRPRKHRGGRKAAEELPVAEHRRLAGWREGRRSRIGAISDSSGSPPVTKRYPAASTIACIDGGPMTRVSARRRSAASRKGCSGRR